MICGTKRSNYPHSQPEDGLQLRLLLINFSNLDGDGDVHTAEGAKSKKDDNVDSSTQSQKSCDVCEHLHETNSLNKLLKLGRVGVVDDDLENNKYLFSKVERSSNNRDDNASDEDWVLVRGLLRFYQKRLLERLI